MTSYWSRFANKRTTRRRALYASGALTLSAAFLAACGGDDADEPAPSTGATGATGSTGSTDATGSTGATGGSTGATGATGATSGLLSMPEDTSASAKPGGTWINWLMSAADTYEPVAATGSVGFTHTMPVYSKFAKNGLGRDGKLPTTDMVTGDAAESWEVSPDRLKYTLKLRQNHLFDPRPPTNNRAMTTEDVKFSMTRFEEGSAFRGEVLNSISPTGFVDSMEYPDDSTIVINLAFPYGPFPDAMAFYPYFNVMPMEAESEFDPRSEMRGSGPFRLTEFQPDVKLVYEKNTDWYEPNRPFLDGFEQVIIPERAAALAQFEAGTLLTLPGIPQEEVLAVKARRSDLVLARDLSLIKAPQFQFFHFTQKPDSSFRDARLRQAISMLIDRDAIIDTFYNIPAFLAEGLPIEGLWHTHDFAGMPNWIDPKNNPDELGEGGQYFQFNPEEASKLISAAGVEGLAFPFEYLEGATSGIYAAMGAMIGEGGFLKPDVKVIDRITHRDYQASKGVGFDGMWPETNGGHNEEAWFINMLHPGGKFTVSTEPIPEISDLALAIRQEPDAEKSNEMMREIQRLSAIEMPSLMLPGYAVGFSLHQPWLKNYQVFVSGDLNPNWSSARIYTEYWYDESEKS